ncbi:hypothetical protein ACIPJM_04815 [Streptomyces halstedii]|uniref:hypothetical protein n=1 Tax=Streptomyces halstedii TaxID=1944 RepID=UPI0037FBA0B0
MNDIVEKIPGTTGSLRERIAAVIENEVPSSYAALATERTTEVIDAWEAEARERARSVTHQMFAGLMPGRTGENMATEVADRVLAAVYSAEQ